MKCVNGWWLPDSESHLQPFILATGSYQLETLNTAVLQAKGRKRAIDIGAHCGLWSRYLCQMFDDVIAFEPVKEHRECFVENVGGNYILHDCALGDKDGRVKMVIDPENTGHTHIGNDGVEVDCRRLDSFDIHDVDFIKMDCEGFEYFVLQGGIETIQREKPVICLEQKPHGFYDIGQFEGVRLLKQWGAKELAKVRADFVMGWK